ncbi:hypothetical protein IAT38_000339 [Cryptococcus sp. DSM 104549]
MDLSIAIVKLLGFGLLLIRAGVMAFAAAWFKSLEDESPEPPCTWSTERTVVQLIVDFACYRWVRQIDWVGYGINAKWTATLETFIYIAYAIFRGPVYLRGPTWLIGGRQGAVESGARGFMWAVGSLVTWLIFARAMEVSLWISIPTLGYVVLAFMGREMRMEKIRAAKAEEEAAKSGGPPVGEAKVAGGAPVGEEKVAGGPPVGEAKVASS